MINGAMIPGGVGGAAGAYVAAIEALKAMGPIVCVEPQDFLDILQKVKEPLVVYSLGGFFTKRRYLTSYKGLVFFTQSKEALLIPASVELVAAKKISVPQM
jgi:hypothetical protein